MANKLFLVSATLAFFFLLANASIYRTIVEFDEDDATNPIGPQRPRQKCQKEARHLRACQEWIRMQARKPSYGPSVEDELDFEDDIENPRPQHQGQLLQQCCNELRQEEPICVCPTLKRAAKAVQDRTQGQQEQQQQQQHVKRIFQTAKNLPNVCRIQQVDVCPFKAVPSFPPYYQVTKKTQ